MLIDLTIPLSDGMKMLGSFPAVEIKKFFSFDDNSGKYEYPCTGCQAESLSLVVHTGTNADSPRHFIRDGLDMENISLEKYMGEAVLIDLTERDDSVTITREQMETAIKKAGGCKKITYCFCIQQSVNGTKKVI